jgi:excisionase family DNA binding protein
LLKIDETKIGGNPMLLIERDSILTTDEAIEYLKISKPTFLKYIHVGRIRAIKAGRVGGFFNQNYTDS